MNFECANHVDVVNEVPSAKEEMLSDLKTIIGDPAIGEKRLEEAKNANNFLQCHSSSLGLYTVHIPKFLYSASYTVNFVFVFFQ